MREFPLTETARKLAGTTSVLIEKGWVAFGGVPFEAVMSPLYVPGAVGYPEIRPLGVMLRPGGKPEATKVIGGVPVAVQV
jgi:hypothetical protein